MTTLEGIVADKWRLLEIKPLGPRHLEFRLRAEAGDKDLGIELMMRDDDVPAFSRGPRYQASYRNGPSLIPIDAPETSEHHRALALQICRTLTSQTQGPEIDWTPRRQAKRYGPDTTMEVIAQDLERSLREDWGRDTLPNPEGWTLRDVRVFQRWVRVVEVILERGRGESKRELAFILSPTEPHRPAYRRSAQFDIIYYSDDLTVDDHDGLFEREQATIERITSWMLRWDGG